jgi:two-component system nitrogen regulation response regulator GlnG
MAPAQVIDAKDLPPEVLADIGVGLASESLPPTPMAAPEAASTRLAPMSTPSPSPSPSPSRLPTPMQAQGGDASDWESGVAQEAAQLLASGQTDVWDAMMRRFESRLILTALTNTRGRRIEAAHKLGIGRNTITRKIQDLGLE